MKHRIGVDIGGTSVKLAVVDPEFQVLHKLKYTTGKGCTAQEIIDHVIEGCKILLEQYPEVEAVGIGSAGRIDSQAGMILRAGNLPFLMEPIVEKVSSAVGLPTFVDNDGSCAMVGEKAAGACKGYKDALIVTLGTGIGGAILVQNKILRGHNNRAGEVGHFVMDLNGKPCECGLVGCFEHYGSATALINQTKEAIQQNPTSILAQVGKDGVEGKTAFEAANQGCPVAKQVLEVYGKYLGIGINSLIKILQPEVIVLTGGISNAGEQLLELIRPHLIPEANVCITMLKGDAGIIGAALLGTDYSD